MPSTLSPEDKKLLMEFLNESLAFDLECHDDLCHHTSDAVECDDLEEHEYLRNIGRIIDSV
jgi:hypothetical protein